MFVDTNLHFLGKSVRLLGCIMCLALFNIIYTIPHSHLVCRLQLLSIFALLALSNVSSSSLLRFILCPWMFFIRVFKFLWHLGLVPVEVRRMPRTGVKASWNHHAGAGNQTKSSVKAINALNCHTISPALILAFFGRRCIKVYCFSLHFSNG